MVPPEFKTGGYAGLSRNIADARVTQTLTFIVCDADDANRSQSDGRLTGRNAYGTEMTQNAVDDGTQGAPIGVTLRHATQLLYAIEHDALLNEGGHFKRFPLREGESPRRTLQHWSPGDSPNLWKGTGQRSPRRLPALKRNTTQLERNNATLTQTYCGTCAGCPAHREARSGHLKNRNS